MCWGTFSDCGQCACPFVSLFGLGFGICNTILVEVLGLYELIQSQLPLSYGSHAVAGSRGDGRGTCGYTHAYSFNNTFATVYTTCLIRTCSVVGPNGALLGNAK